MRQVATDHTTRRGGALIALGGVLALWAVLRLAIWQPPFVPASLSDLAASLPELGDLVADSKKQPDLPASVQIAPAAPFADPYLPNWQGPPPLPIPSEHEQPLRVSPIAYHDIGAGYSPLARRGFGGASNIVAHAYLLSAGYSSGASPHSQAWTNGAPAPVYIPHEAEAIQRSQSPARWAMDAWALWRQDNDSPLLSGRPSYGRSQVGAVMRYRLSPSSGHAPQLHLRASAALEGRREREVAFGASARPVPDIPVRLAAEARVSETDRRTEPRAAAYAVTEFAPLDLPGGLTGEAYLQGGYVTGDFATPFVDGQARITRDLAGTDGFRLSAGAGAWGGVQDDARRLDVGPSAAMTFRVGPARGRVSADYRFRVAGDAEPASGPALTLSAGF